MAGTTIDSTMLSVDLSTPTGAAAVLAFLLLIFASYRSRWSGTPLLLALVGTGMTIISYMHADFSGPLLADFGLQLVLLWITSVS